MDVQEIPLTREELKTLFDYDDGYLIWKISTGNARPGKIAGYFGFGRYTRITFGARNFLAHRLIWKWHHGTEPGEMIEHIDNDPTNNRIENLKDGTARSNRRARTDAQFDKIYHDGNGYIFNYRIKAEHRDLLERLRDELAPAIAIAEAKLIAEEAARKAETKK